MQIKLLVAGTEQALGECLLSCGMKDLDLKREFSGGERCQT